MEWELAELWNKGALQFDEFCETVILSSSHIPSFAFTFLMKAVQGIATYIQVLLIGICTQKYILASGDVILSCWQGPWQSNLLFSTNSDYAVAGHYFVLSV